MDLYRYELCNFFPLLYMLHRTQAGNLQNLQNLPNFDSWHEKFWYFLLEEIATTMWVVHGEGSGMVLW